MTTHDNGSQRPWPLKTLLLATLAGGVAMWIVAGLFHTVIAAAFYRAETHASHDGTGIILLAYLVLGGLMAYLYPLFDRGGPRVLTGLKLGALVGLLWVFPHGLAMAGAHDTSILYVVRNGAWHLVEQGLGGLVIALVYRPKTAPSPVNTAP